jgi:hypothetical protein
MERLQSDPERLTQHRAKERERARNNRKLVHDLSLDDLIEQQKKWQEKAQDFRARKRAVEIKQETEWQAKRQQKDRSGVPDSS